MSKALPLYHPTQVYPFLVAAVIVTSSPIAVVPDTPLTVPASAILFSRAIGQTTHLAVISISLSCVVINSFSEIFVSFSYQPSKAYPGFTSGTVKSSPTFAVLFSFVTTGVPLVPAVEPTSFAVNEPFNDVTLKVT